MALYLLLYSLEWRREVVAKTREGVQSGSIPRIPSKGEWWIYDDILKEYDVPNATDVERCFFGLLFYKQVDGVITPEQSWKFLKPIWTHRCTW
jgi:hypothetical protein